MARKNPRTPSRDESRYDELEREIDKLYRKIDELRAEREEIADRVVGPRKTLAVKPKSRVSGSAARGKAAAAMRLFHSGQVSSLAEAWKVVNRRRHRK